MMLLFLNLLLIGEQSDMSNSNIEMISNINIILGNEISTTSRFYFVKKEDSQNKLYLANMEPQLLEEATIKMKNQITTSITGSNLEVIDFLTADERPQVIYRFKEGTSQLGKINKILSQINSNVTKYNNSKFNDIELFISYLESDDHNIITFKIIYPFQTIRKNTAIMFKHDQLVPVEDNLFRYSYEFDFFVSDEVLYILNLEKFEKFFNLNTIIKNEANKLLKVIKPLNYFDEKNFLPFNKYITEDIKLGKKFLKGKTNISESFSKIKFKELEQYATSNNAYKDIVEVNSKGDSFVISSKESVINIIKLFNEDRWESPLTKNIYDAKAKDKI